MTSSQESNTPWQTPTTPCISTMMNNNDAKGPPAIHVTSTSTTYPGHDVALIVGSFGFEVVITITNLPKIDRDTVLARSKPVGRWSRASPFGPGEGVSISYKCTTCLCAFTHARTYAGITTAVNACAAASSDGECQPYLRWLWTGWSRLDSNPVTDPAPLCPRFKISEYTKLGIHSLCINDSKVESVVTRKGGSSSIGSRGSGTSERYSG
jgi:hypothetical protein